MSNYGTVTPELEKRSAAAASDPSLSILMPVRNGGPFLRDALDSLLGQSFKDFKLLISDNASNDETADILEEYSSKDARIEVTTQPENIGAIPNFRAVFDKADTKYVMFAAADDIWAPDWVEKVLAVAVSGPCMAYSFMFTVDEDGVEVPHPANIRVYQFDGTRSKRRLKFFAEPMLLGKVNAFYGIFEKHLFNDAVWDAYGQRRNCPDAFALFAFLENAPIVHVPGTCHFKRKHPKSIANDRAITPDRSRIRPFRRTQLPDYLRAANDLEATFCILLYPVARAWMFAAKIRYYLRKTPAAGNRRVPR